MIRKAIEADIPAIADIYARTLALEDKEKRTGWLKDIYPVEATARAALERGDLYVYCENGRILATAIINQTQVDVYSMGAWSSPTPDSEVSVIHTLAVDPDEYGKGIAKAFLTFYEDEARKAGMKALRLDTNAINKKARAMYKALGYTEIGAVPCVFNGIPDVKLVLIEKLLT